MTKPHMAATLKISIMTEELQPLDIAARVPILLAHICSVFHKGLPMQNHFFFVHTCQIFIFNKISVLLKTPAQYTIL